MKYQKVNDAQQHAADRLTQRKLQIACTFAIVFMLIELFGGYISGSLAIISDAAHLLSDVAGFLISLLATSIGKLPPSKFLSYGFRRAEVLGALSSVFLIWVLTIWLVFESIHRLLQDFQGEVRDTVDGKAMLIIALFGLGVNFCLMRILGHGHSHLPSYGHSHCTSTLPDMRILGHGHSHLASCGHSHCSSTLPDMSHHHHSHSEVHNVVACTSGTQQQVNHVYDVHDDHVTQNHSVVSTVTVIPTTTTDVLEEIELGVTSTSDTIEKAIPVENINLKAAYIHALGDFIQSIGVCIAGGIIWYSPEWKVIDPIITFIFAIIVLFTTVGVFKQSIQTLMEGTPFDIDHTEIYNGLNDLEHVHSVHDLHIWSLTIGMPSLSVHLVSNNPEKCLILAQRFLHSKGISHSTIQVETYGTEYFQDCSQLFCGQVGNSVVNSSK